MSVRSGGCEPGLSQVLSQDSNFQRHSRGKSFSVDLNLRASLRRMWFYFDGRQIAIGAFTLSLLDLVTGLRLAKFPTLSFQCFLQFVRGYDSISIFVAFTFSSFVGNSFGEGFGEATKDSRSVS